MTTENTPPTPAAEPQRKKGAHKPDCPCGWCNTRRANLAKKKAVTQSQSAETQKADSDAAKGSGEGLSASSAQNSPPPEKSAIAKGSGSPIPAKIAAMEKAKALAHGQKTKAQKTNEPKTPQPEKTGWFEKLFSAPNTFFES